MDDLGHELSNRLEKWDQLTETFLRYKMKLLDTKQKHPQFRMNATKYHILKTIYQHNSCIVADISRRLQLSSGATTLSLNQLEQDALIVRLRSEENRRTVKTTLTPQGTKLIQEAMEIRNRLLEDMLETLTLEEREQFFHLIGKISDQLARKMDVDMTEI